MQKPRTVLITGGSAGIGHACVERFHKAGDRVHFTYRSGQQAARSIEDLLGDRATAHAFDQGDSAAAATLVAEVGVPIHVLVNNAGLGSKTVEGYVDEHRSQDEAMLRVNATGMLWLTQEVLPQMVSNGYGKVVNLSSVGGGVAVFPRFRASDGMSKAAVAYLTRQLAAEHVHTPVDVFGVCPGATRTPMFEGSTLGAMAPAERQAYVAALPKGRLIEAAEIAEVIHFLTTDAARVLHGAVIDASMGLGVHPGLVTGVAP